MFSNELVIPNSPDANYNIESQQKYNYKKQKLITTTNKPNTYATVN